MDKSTNQALVEWVNSFPLSQPATGFSSLNGGHTIWEVLRDIDSSYFAGSLPESPHSIRKTWHPRWENLKHIYQALTTFLVEESGKEIPKTLLVVDLKMIAMESDAVESVKLLKLILLAAISSPRSMEFIGRMPNLSLSTQNLLKEWIMEIGESPEDEPNGLDDHDNSSSPRSPGGQDLYYEERIGGLTADNDKLKKDREEMRLALEDLEDRLEHSQTTNSALERRLAKTEERLREQNAAEDALGSNKLLVAKIQQQEEVIAGLETDVSELQTNKDSMEKTIDKFKSSSGKSQQLQDAYDELKTDRDNLARKANAAEKYKQKLQAGSDIQKENEGLRDELSELRQDYEAARGARQKVAGLQLAVDEYKRVLPKIEQERHELQMMKKQLEFDNQTLAQRCEKASQQYNKDQTTIADFNARSGGDLNGSPSSPNARAKGGLESEFTARSEGEEQSRASFAELKDSNRRLQLSVGESQAKIGMLEQMLDDVREHSEERESRHLEAYQEFLVLQASLGALRKGQEINETEIFQKTSDRLEAEQKAKNSLEQQLKRTEEQLRESQNDLSLVDKDKLTALRELKKNQSAELTIAQRETKALNRRIVDLETDRAGLQSLLRNDADKKSSQEQKTGVDVDKLKDLIDDLKSAAQGRSAASTAEALEIRMVEYGNTVKETNAKLAAREEQIKNLNAELRTLQDSLQRHQSHPHEPPTPAKTGTPNEEAVKSNSESQAQCIASLQRENRLMATAYHTLAGRLQMTSVTLQRKSETPTAWLNKQRKLVDQQVVLPAP